MELKKVLKTLEKERIFIYNNEKSFIKRLNELNRSPNNKVDGIGEIYFSDVYLLSECFIGTEASFFEQMYYDDYFLWKNKIIGKKPIK